MRYSLTLNEQVRGINEPYQRYQIVGSPAAEILTVADAKAQLIVDTSFTADDTLIESYIAAARTSAEQYAGICFVNTSIIETFDYWPIRYDFVRLSWGRVSSVTSIQYVDVDGNTQTWDSSKYIVNNVANVCEIRPAYGESWPEIRDQSRAITINYVSGFGDTAADVPASIVQAVRLMLGSFYENRVDSVFKMPTASEYLLNPYRSEII